jgi:hypothetical protein
MSSRPAACDDQGETDLRRRLGIPDDARRVLVISETSHWDPDWLLTSEGYFRLRVRRTLDRALDELRRDDRRVYSVECVFFLAMYYERVPARRQEIRDLVNAGRLRMMGPGVTTPDTIVPPAELLVRDYLLGQEWLRTHGMHAEPDIACFPDTFGFSPGLPEVLRSVGIDKAAVCRIDGMYFFGNETELPGRFPRPGSSAELLARRERTLDFVWRAPNGAEVLCHWLAFTYGQGDMIAHAGITRQAGVPLAVPWPSDRHVARNIARYVGKLEPLARTPYLLCPIGFDFTSPVRNLVELLDRYNRRHHPETGTWVVNAGIDDYLSLVDHHRHRLPVVDLDPSQYFTGFFGSRPTVKRRYRELTDHLALAERLAVAPGAPGAPGAAGTPAGPVESVRRRLEGPWWTAVVANHHDFVTGTSPDRVVHREQLPWLDDALATAKTVVEEMALVPRPGGSPAGPRSGSGRATWHRDGPVVEVVAAGMRVVCDGRRGGAVVAVTDDAGNPLLGDGPSFDPVAYIDSGGLWRAGLEYAGGRYEEVDRASNRPAVIDVVTGDDGTVGVASTGVVDGLGFHRLLTFGPDRRIDCHLVVEAGHHRTVTVQLTLAGPAGGLVTDVPGGVATRPVRRWFDPTYWSVQTFAAVTGGPAILFGLPAAIALVHRGPPPGRSQPDVAEILAARNASGETAYRLFRLPAQPARGHDPGPHPVDLAVLFTGDDDWRTARLPAVAAAHARRARLSDADEATARAADRVVTVDRDDVLVTATKPANRGQGIVVRLESFAETPCTVHLRWPGVPLDAAATCDGRERDVGPLPLDPNGEGAVVPVAPGLTSVRLVARPAGAAAQG